MCGICGVVARDPRDIPLSPDDLTTMVDSLRHRGPDDRGELLAPGIAMGMRRLSIIDVAGGHQPVVNEAQTVWAMQNGEIYNFARLRERLTRDHVLASRCDTEVIVHLYEESAEGFQDHLRGMYAIAVWDGVRRRLTLVRDRLGIKPLYISETKRGLAFASEIKALLAAGLVEPKLDREGAELFLAYGYVPGPRTLFEGVQKLMPATVLVYEAGTAKHRSYWSPVGSNGDLAMGSPSELEEQLLALLRSSVREHLIADVPLGLMLSGGLDSSLIGALMAEATTGPIKTFSIGFSNLAASNELVDARRVAERLGAEHYELELDPQDDPAILEDMLWHLEEPVTDLSCLGFQLLSELAQRHVKVALSGQGADELLGGYRKHQIAHGADVVAKFPFAQTALLAAGAAIGRSGSTAERGLRAIGEVDHVRRLLAMSRVTQPDQMEELFTARLRTADGERVIGNAIRQHELVSSRSILTQTRHTDLRMALVDQLFLYFDKMSMSTSLEVRVPFVDDRLVTFCFTLPDDASVSLLRRKAILRRVARDIISPDTISKKKVGFFHSALVGWLKRHRFGYVQDVLLSERCQARGQLNTQTVRGLLNSDAVTHKKGAQVVFSALMLELWQRLYADGDFRTRLAASRSAARSGMVGK
jgi:asparagine synthase (glutamine-hydrolysing)